MADYTPGAGRIKSSAQRTNASVRSLSYMTSAAKITCTASLCPIVVAVPGLTGYAAGNYLYVSQINKILWTPCEWIRTLPCAPAPSHLSVVILQGDTGGLSSPWCCVDDGLLEAHTCLTSDRSHLVLRAQLAGFCSVKKLPVSLHGIPPNPAPSPALAL